MFSAALSGFALSLSLILAIGAQNSFVIRQGLLNQHVLAVVLFCGISDMALICLGALGLGQLLAPIFDLYSQWLFGLAALWLAVYGILRFRDGLMMNTKTDLDEANLCQPAQASLTQTLSVVLALTFANPHVYLDTVILVGSVGAQLVEMDQLLFVLGASAGSITWFISLCVAGRLLQPVFQKPIAWKVLHGLVGATMWVIAYSLVATGS